MKTLFTFLLSVAALALNAQDSWKVSLDKKSLLSTSSEDAEKNVVKLSAADLKKSLVIAYTEASPQKGWERTITIYNDKDAELKKATSKKLTLKASDLKKLFEKSKTLKIYTVNMPTDPKMKAQVRIRRVHLCTLILE